MRLFAPIPLLAVAALVAGCKTPAEARYVARASEHGVIAMSADTPENRARAEALMRSHFPEGYEVVWEGEEAVVGPPPARYAGGYEDPAYVHHRRMSDPIAAARHEADFQREIESLPGTPQSMEGYARPPAPAVGVYVGDPPPAPTGVIRSEWRITYRRKGSTATPDGPGGGEQSLYPQYQR